MYCTFQSDNRLEFGVIHHSVFRSLLGNQKGAATKKPEPVTRKKPQKECLMDPNRSQNVAIAKKKLAMSSDDIRQAITR